MVLGKLTVDELNIRKMRNDFSIIEDETRNCIVILRDGEEVPVVSEKNGQGFLSNLDLLL